MAEQTAPDSIGVIGSNEAALPDETASMSFSLLSKLGQPLDDETFSEDGTVAFKGVSQLSTDRYTLKQSEIQSITKYPPGDVAVEGRSGMGWQLEVCDRTQPEAGAVLVAQLPESGWHDEIKVTCCEVNPEKLLDYLNETLSPETADHQANVMGRLQMNGVVSFQDEAGKVTIAALEQMPGRKSPDLLIVATGMDKAEQVVAVRDPEQNPQKVCKAFQKMGVFERENEKRHALDRFDALVETERDQALVAPVPEEKVESIRSSAKSKAVSASKRKDKERTSAGAEL